MSLGLTAHFLFGGSWAGVLWLLAKPVSASKALLLSLGLWLFMQLAVLPVLGWGRFGSRLTLSIAAATLLLHVVYGGTLAVAAQSGWRMAGQNEGAAMRSGLGAT